MDNLPIKSASKNIPKKSFYLFQKNGDDKRYVITLTNKDEIIKFFHYFINQSLTEVQITISDLKNEEQTIDYVGVINKAELIELIVKHQDVIFHNGFHELMIMIPNTNECLIFDDHGLLFIYTEKDYNHILDELNAKYKPREKLIYEDAHWHYCLPKGEEKLTNLIEEMRLVNK